MKSTFLALLALAGSCPLFASTYYVDVAKGDDSGVGSERAPFKTTAKGIDAARPGDTVVILKVDFPIHEMLVISNKSGEAGHPVTLDGGGNLFTGCDPITAGDWTQVKPGLFRNDHLVPDIKKGRDNSFITRRYFMLWNGRQQRMGRSSKGRLPPLPALGELKPGEWSYVDAEAAFYIAIDPAKKLSDYAIEAPVRQNGVAVRGTCLHWVLRNINTTHVINDGFNLHGHMDDFIFENITSTECGDDGLSAHEDSRIEIHGFVSRRNSTGICHAGTVTSLNENVVLEDNYGGNLILWNGTHTFINSTVSAVAPAGGLFGIHLLNEAQPGSNRVLTTTFKRCKIPFPAGEPAPGDKPPFLVSDNAKLDIDSNTVINGTITKVPAKKNSSGTPGGVTRLPMIPGMKFPILQIAGETLRSAAGLSSHGNSVDPFLIAPKGAF